MKNNWKETTLDKAIELVGGGTPRTSIVEYWNGDIPWLSVVDFNNDSRWVEKTDKAITENGLKNSSTKLLDAGDLIISARGTVGELAQLKYPMAFNQSCYGIKANENSDINFLFYLIKWKIKNIKKNVHGAVFDTITKNTFEKIDILLPSLPEQKQIASVLSSLDDKIELLRRQNETLEKIAQGIFKEWFVNFKIDGKKLKLKNGIPEGWRVGKLEDIVEFINGFAFKSQDLMCKEFGECYKVFKMGHIMKGGGFDSSKTRDYVQKEKFKNHKKYVLLKGDLLMSMTDMKDSISLLGHTALMASNYEYIVNQRVGLIRVRNKLNIGYPFLYLLTNSEKFISNLRGRANSGVQVNLSTFEIKNSPIVIPDEKINENFSKISMSIFEKIFLNNSQIQTLSRLRDTLLPKLMKSEVQVKEVEYK
ncbi:MAG: restriction endonuclease subunit S [Candidatus Moraniibacteriota bacterium]